MALTLACRRPAPTKLALGQPRHFRQAPHSSPVWEPVMAAFIFQAQRCPPLMIRRGEIRRFAAVQQLGRFSGEQAVESRS